MDHNVPTLDGPVTDPLARAQLDALRAQLRRVRRPLFATGSGREGIVHVIGPELGLTQPGMTIVCGDSHTSTHGAFGALAFGIGTSEVEHVLATQTLPQAQPKTMEVRFDGDAALRRDGKGHGARGDRPDRRRGRRRPRARVHGRGDPRALDGRPHDGLQHVDRGRRARRAWSRPTIRRLPTSRAGRARRRAPTGSARSTTGARCATDDGADVRPTRSSSTLARSKPQVTWGTNPGMVAPVDGVVPDPERLRRSRAARGRRARAALHGSRARDAARRHRASTGLHRLVHERAHRGPARGRGGRRGPARRGRRARDGRPGLGAGEAPGRGGGLDRDLHSTPASSGGAPAARCAWA